MLDEVAVIDEIQMMRDNQRGWAWTRALLGRLHLEHMNVKTTAPQRKQINKNFGSRTYSVAAPVL